MDTASTTGRPPLPTELLAATRGEHATLNRTIIARLPLCLPTATATPNLYAQGMTVFSQIYYGFEDAWDTLLSDETINQRQREMLEQLDIPRLRRKERLEESLQQLRSRLPHASAVQLSTIQSATLHFQDEIRKSILERPHLILAYTWTMYLALFNGGRWIAKQLLSPGPLFWRHEDRAATVSGPLSFWFFGNGEDYDGDDIKVAFKDRFNSVAEGLTDQERSDVIAESKKLFQTCADMITFLDQNVEFRGAKQGTQLPTAVCPFAAQQTNSSGTTNLLAAFTPSTITSLWRCIANMVPLQRTLAIPLRPEVERQH